MPWMAKVYGAIYINMRIFSSFHLLATTYNLRIFMFHGPAQMMTI